MMSTTVKVIATHPSCRFPVINNNNSPFDRQRVIVRSLLDKGYKVEQLITSDLMSWQDVAKLDIHDPDYLRFLSEAYTSFERDLYHKDFVMSVGDSHLLVLCNINRHIKNNRKTNDQYRYKEIGNYTNDMLTPIFKELDTIVRLAISDAIAGAKVFGSGDFSTKDFTTKDFNSESKVVAVIPCHPGHHSGYSNFSGFCYLNNSVVAYVELLNNGFKPALLDLDFHAGDGSDDIARRLKLPNVKSVHIDPDLDYPFYVSEEFDNSLAFQGHCNIQHYLRLVETSLQQFTASASDILVIAFGSDIYHLDPKVVPQYRTELDIDDYVKIAKLIKQYFNKVLIIQEGVVTVVKQMSFSPLS
jgi:acetoin utilization deacetylase AcuC-like enzyme